MPHTACSVSDCAMHFRHKRLLGHAVNQALSLLSPQNVKFAFRKNFLSCNKLRALSRKSEFRVKLEWSLGTGDLGPSTVE